MHLSSPTSDEKKMAGRKKPDILGRFSPETEFTYSTD
jgi:hypothetical protein